MIKIIDDIEIKDKEIFGFVGLADSDRTTILRKIYRMYPDKIRYVDELPWNFLKVKTVLCKNKNHEYVKKIGLNINKRISDLNYNETRKLLFLLSIFTNKEIIILDEPMLLVEHDTKKVMLEIIASLNKTILISFDNIAESKIICDRYAIVKEFKIVEICKNNKDIGLLSCKVKAKNIDKASLPLKNMKIDYFSHNEIEFVYNGDINDLIKCLSNIKIDFLEIKESGLEEIYKYYLK